MLQRKGAYFVHILNLHVQVIDILRVHLVVTLGILILLGSFNLHLNQGRLKGLLSNAFQCSFLLFRVLYTPNVVCVALRSHDLED